MYIEGAELHRRKKPSKQQQQQTHQTVKATKYGGKWPQPGRFLLTLLILYL